MKANRLLTIATLAITVLFPSCNVNDEIASNDPIAVPFSSGISAIQTKVGGAGGDQWDIGDPVGIYMVKCGSTTVVESVANIRYTAASNGTSTAFTSATPIYYPLNTPTKVDFIAYHPHHGAMNGYTYPVNVAKQISQSDIDLMTATADNHGAGYDKSYTSPINLPFTHRLAKVVMNVTAGGGIDNLRGLTVLIKGMNTTASFDITTGALREADKVIDITPYNVGGYSYEAILLPVALDDTHTVAFTIGDNTYLWTMRENTGGITALAAGNRYTFEVSVQKHAIVVSGTINAWGNGGNETGTLE